MKLYFVLIVCFTLVVYGTSEAQQIVYGSQTLVPRVNMKAVLSINADCVDAQSYQSFLDTYFSKTLSLPLKILTVSDAIELEKQSKYIKPYSYINVAGKKELRQINPFLQQIENYYKAKEYPKPNNSRMMNHFMANHPHKEVKAIGKVQKPSFDALLLGVVGAESSQMLAEDHELLLCIFSKKGKLLSAMTLMDWMWDFEGKKQDIAIHHKVILTQSLGIITEVVTPAEKIVDMNPNTGYVKAIPIEKVGHRCHYLISKDGIIIRHH